MAKITFFLISCFILVEIFCNNHANAEYVKNNYKIFSRWEKDRTTIVHLENWKYEDVKKECTEVLGPKGYAAVEISPVTSYAKDGGRLSVSSYTIDNDSGNEQQLQEMIKECNSQKVKVIISVVLNNMMKPGETPPCDDYKEKIKEKTYGACGQPPMYTSKDFHDSSAPLTEEDYKNSIEKVRTGEFIGRHDLKQIIDGKPNQHMIDFLNKLIKMGAGGFKIISADHMDPEELVKIYDSLDDQAIAATPTRPFIYSNVYDPLHSNEWAIKDSDYVKYTRVTDFKYAADLALSIKDHKKPLSAFQTIEADQKSLNYLDGNDSIVFISTSLTDKFKNRAITPYPTIGHEFINAATNDKAYKLATAFILSLNHGIAMISSKAVDKRPEHRWPRIQAVIKWRSEIFKAYATGGFPSSNKWKVISDYQVGFCVGKFGFAVFNAESEKDLTGEFDTCFDAPGTYCDVYSGSLKDQNGKTPQEICSGSFIVVDQSKKAKITLKAGDGDGVQLYNFNAAKLH